MGNRTSLRGVRELDAALKELAGPAQKRVTRAAVQAAARILRREVRNAAPRGQESPHPQYGRLRDNIRLRVKPTASKLVATVHTGSAFWARWLEFGRQAIAVKKQRVLSNGKTIFGSKVAAQPARPFFRPAWDRVSPRLLPEMTKRIATGIGREAEKLRRGRR